MGRFGPINLRTSQLQWVIVSLSQADVKYTQQATVCVSAFLEIQILMH